MSNANVLQAIADMESHLRVLSQPCDVMIIERIYRDASICDQLMQYSYLVADTDSENWHKLCVLVDKVLVKSAQKMNIENPPT